MCNFFLIIIFLCSFAIFQPLPPAPYNGHPCLWIHGSPNRPFHGFLQLLTWSEGTSVDFSGKGTFKLVRLLSLKSYVENYKRYMYRFSKSWNFTGFYMVGSTTLPPIQVGKFTNFKVLFPAMSTDLSKLVHVKSRKNRWKGLQSKLHWWPPLHTGHLSTPATFFCPGGQSTATSLQWQWSLKHVPNCQNNLSTMASFF